MIEHTSYTPYGLSLQGASASRYSYEGKEFDDTIGQYDFHFRGYKADWGLFVQPDSLIADVYDPQNLNRYAFERNNPYNIIDPDGHAYQVLVLHPAGWILLALSGLTFIGMMILMHQESQKRAALSNPGLEPATAEDVLAVTDNAMENANIASDDQTQDGSFELSVLEVLTVNLDIEEEGTSTLPADVKKTQDENLNNIIAPNSEEEQTFPGGTYSIGNYVATPAGCTQQCTVTCDQYGNCQSTCTITCNQN